MADETLTIRALLEDEVSNRVPRIRRELDALEASVNRSNRAQVTGAANASRSVAQLSRSYSDLNQKISAASAASTRFAGNAITRVTQVASAGGAALTAWGVTTTSNIQQASIALETFLGRDVAARMFGQLRELDKASAFTFQELASSTQQLAAFGVEQDKLYNLVGSISEIAAGTGKGVSGLQQLSLAIGQVATAGRLTGDEARQLAEFIPIYQLVGETYGTTAAQAKQAMEDGFIVPSSLVINAIADQTGALAKFSGLNEKQLDTLRGQWSAFKSDMAIIAGGSPLEGQKGAFAPLTEELQKELPIATQIFGDALWAIGPPLSRAAAGLLRLTQAVVPLITPYAVKGLDGVGIGLMRITSSLQGAESGGGVDAFGRLVDEAGEFVPIAIDLARATGPVLRDLATLTSNVLPFTTGVLQPVVHWTAELTSESKVASVAAGALITTFLGWRFVGGAITTIQAATTAINGLATAEGRAAAASKFGVLGRLGLAGAAGVGIYSGASAEKGSLDSAIGLVGGGAAAGALVGSVVPVIGTGVGAGIGALAGGIAYAARSATGDVGGNLARSMIGHRTAESMTPGSRMITSGYRNWGLASGASGHLNGSALDVAGPWMASYMQNVKASGGWASMHDNGSGKHVHAEFGDSPYAARSAAGSGAGGVMINMTVYANSQVDMDRARRELKAELEKLQRERAVRL